MDMDFGKLGFGFLRLPLTENGEVDLETTKKMVDLYLKRGYSYFDTAYIYLEGNSERALRQAVVERYPRESFQIADKLLCSYLKKGMTAQQIFAEQLGRCGVDYFDVYLLHGLDGEDAAYAEKMGCFDFLQEQKAQGRIRYTGFSFHDTADVLDQILARHPEIDLVQIQLNYLDWENPIIQSRACYEVCRRHGKPILVMEPIKGGTLASIPEQAERLLDGEAPAHRALRFVASQESVAVVLSGMSTLKQVEENTALMSPFFPLNRVEMDVLPAVAQIIRENVAIPCTGCAYCVAGCPAGIPIPQYFSLYNEQERDKWQANAQQRYEELNQQFPRAESCLSCGQCELECPQKLPIREFMSKVSTVFDMSGND